MEKDYNLLKKLVNFIRRFHDLALIKKLKKYKHALLSFQECEQFGAVCG